MIFVFNERRALQIAILIGGLVPVLSGIGGIILGHTLLSAVASPALDNHVRYLSGLLLGIGLSFWSAIPTIETPRMTARCRFLTLIVVIGGMGRLYGALTQPYPGLPMMLALGMELIVTPLLCLWQIRVARLFGPEV